MKHAFLILAHTDPEQLKRLISSLNSDSSLFYIHWDKKNESVLFESPIIKELQSHSNIHFITNRIKVYWGGASIVYATIELLKEAFKEQDITYFHLLSGIDYPLKPLQYIFRFFENNKNNYLTYIPQESNMRYFIERYYFYDNDYINPQNKKRSIKRTIVYQTLLFIQRCTWFLVQVLGIRIRKKVNMQFYHGTQWFSLHRNAVTYIIKFLNENSWILKRFKYTAVCDETFFIMLLMNNSQLKDSIINNDLRLRLYDGMPNRSGYILTEKDFELIKNSDALFGRKFVSGKSEKLIELINNMFLTQSNS